MGVLRKSVLAVVVGLLLTALAVHLLASVPALIASAYVKQLRDKGRPGTFGVLVYKLVRGLVAFLLLAGVFIWLVNVSEQAGQLVRATVTAFTTFIRVLSTPAA